MRKCGANQFIPRKPIRLTFSSTVSSTMHEHNGKKYFCLDLPPEIETKISEIHKDSIFFMTGSKIVDPKEGSTLKVKVPYKYNKVTCTVLGLKAVQELALGDKVDVILNYCGIWNVNDFSGPSWKLESIHSL